MKAGILIGIAGALVAFGLAQPASVMDDGLGRRLRLDPDIPEYDWASYRPLRAYCYYKGDKRKEVANWGIHPVSSGVQVFHGEPRSPKPNDGFHLSYSTYAGNFVLSRDGTVDARLFQDFINPDVVRYYVPREDVKRLIKVLQRLHGWGQTSSVHEAMDDFQPKFDLDLDGRRYRRVWGGSDIAREIERTLRVDELERNLRLRVQILDANGFNFKSIAGADFALWAIHQPHYGKDDLDYLVSLGMPCVGGMYENYPGGLPQHDPKALSLQQALIATGHSDIASRLSPAPPLPPWGSNPSWRVYPDDAMAWPYYPEQAKREAVTGSASIDCLMTATGRLELCDAASARPASYGFAQATVRLMQENAIAEPGQFSPGQVVRVTWNWHVPKT